MTAQVIRFPRPVDTRDLAAALRFYADELEAGRIAAKSALLVVHHGVGFLPETVGLGEELNRLETAAVLDMAHLHAQAVAFRGPHA